MTTNTNRLEQLISILEETRTDHEKFFDSGGGVMYQIFRIL